jgi:hypothetical protein
MKDSLKIAIGIILGVLGLLACFTCAVLILSAVGLAALSSAIQPFSPTAPIASPTHLISLPTIAPSTALPTNTSVVTPTATAIPVLSLGETIKWGGLSITVRSYEVTQTCPGGDGRPADGAKFVIIYVQASNSGMDVIDIPSLKFKVAQYESGLGAGLPCQYNDQAFGNACWQWSGKLYPQVACEGWELFEVPSLFPVEGSSVRIFTYTLRPGEIQAAEWLLSD